MVNVEDTSGWEKIVFFSTLDKERNKSQVADIWKVTKSGGPIYRTSTRRGLKILEDSGLLVKKGNTFQADLQGEDFKQHLVNEFKDSENQVKRIIAEDIDQFIIFLTNDAVKNHILKPDNVKEYFGFNQDKNQAIKNAKDADIMSYFSAIINASSALWVPDAVQRITSRDDFNIGIPNQVLEGAIKGGFSGMVENIDEQSSNNIKALVENIEQAYEEDSEAFEVILNSYDKEFMHKASALS